MSEKPPLRYMEGLLGPWDVMYPSADGKIDKAYSERLVLRDDCTYSWNPAPPWAANIGRWTVMDTEDGLTRLCFEARGGSRFRCNYLVVIQFDPSETHFFNWTRTRGDAVIFTDRIFQATRPPIWNIEPDQPAQNPASST